MLPSLQWCVIPSCPSTTGKSKCRRAANPSTILWRMSRLHIHFLRGIVDHLCCCSSPIYMAAPLSEAIPAQLP